MRVVYLHLAPNVPLPSTSATAPFAAVVLAERAVSPEWRDQVSRWLVGHGCLYAMTWGVDCEAWHDSFDWANIDSSGSGDIPEAKLVMTTWHDQERREEVFWFAQYAALHPAVTLEWTILLDVRSKAREEALLAEFAHASYLHARETKDDVSLN
jgi:hypothetical protein